VYVEIPAKPSSDIVTGSALAGPFIESGFWSLVESIVHVLNTWTIPKSSIFFYISNLRLLIFHCTVPAPLVPLRDALGLIEKGAKTYRSRTRISCPFLLTPPFFISPVYFIVEFTVMLPR
jgi:hypothetical protein